MADETNKAVNMARSITQNTNKMMEAIEALRALEDERASSGLDLTAHDAAYLTHDDLQHVDGNMLNLVNSSVSATWTFMTTNNHDDNFQGVRP